MSKEENNNNNEINDGLLDGLDMQDPNYEEKNNDDDPNNNDNNGGLSDSNKKQENLKDENNTIDDETLKTIENIESEVDEEVKNKSKIDTNKYTIQEILGDGFKNLDEIKSSNIVEKSKKYDQLTSQYNNLQTQYDLAVKKLKTKSSPFVNDSVKRYNQFVKSTKIENAQVFSLLDKSDFNNMDAIDVLALEQFIDKPTGNLATIRRLVEQNYKQGEFIPLSKDEDGNETPNPDPLSKERLQMDADAARIKLNDLKEKLNINDDNNIDEKVEEVQKAWSDLTPRVVKEFPTSFDINITKDGKVKTVGQYQFSNVDIDRISKVVSDVSNSMGDLPTKENIQGFWDKVTKGIKSEFSDELNLCSYNRGIRDATKYYKMKNNNIPGSNNDAKPLTDENRKDVPEGGKTVDEVYEMEQQ